MAKQGYTPLHVWQEKIKEKHAKKQEDLGRYREVMEHSQTMEEKGLRRLILPEYHRPFIQKLSAAAGKIARADLKNMT